MRLILNEDFARNLLSENDNRKKINQLIASGDVDNINIAINLIESMPEYSGVLDVWKDVVEKANNLHGETFAEKVSSFLSKKEVSFSQRGLDKIPKGFVYHDNPVMVNLSNNNLSYLPSFVTSNDKIEYLYLSFNNFDGFPKTLTQMDKLKVLMFNSNGVQDLPESILGMKSLERLSLKFNYLEHPPEILFEMKWLGVLNLQGNYIDKGFYKRKFKEALPYTRVIL